MTRQMDETFSIFRCNYHCLGFDDTLPRSSSIKNQRLGPIISQSKKHKLWRGQNTEVLAGLP
jgi:hypothetical protein